MGDSSQQTNLTITLALSDIISIWRQSPLTDIRERQQNELKVRLPSAQQATRFLSAGQGRTVSRCWLCDRFFLRTMLLEGAGC